MRRIMKCVAYALYFLALTVELIQGELSLTNHDCKVVMGM